MTGAIAVRSTTYVAESLRLRIGDLGHALSILANVPVGRSVSVTDPAAHVVFESNVRALTADIHALKLALESVWFTLDPVEAERASIARGALPVFAQYVMSGIPAVMRDARSGKLWALARPLFGELIRSVHHSASTDGSVAVTASNPRSVIAPTTLAERVSRIPSGDTHIRIDRFSTVEGPRFEVYLSGTNFSGGADDPWNAQSNLDLARTGSAPSLLAVTRALELAGVTSTSAIVITGHSQGGLLALAVARSGQFNVDAVITVGTPVGVIPDVPDIPTIHVVHPEDPVPSLGGTIVPGSGAWVIAAEPGVTLIQAHDRASYIPSMTRLDQQHEPEVDRLLSRINAEGVGESRDFRATASDQNR